MSTAFLVSEELMPVVSFLGYLSSDALKDDVTSFHRVVAFQARIFISVSPCV